MMGAEALPAMELYPRSYAALLRFAGVGTDPQTGAPLHTPLAVSLCGWVPGLSAGAQQVRSSSAWCRTAGRLVTTREFQSTIDA